MRMKSFVSFLAGVILATSTGSFAVPVDSDEDLLDEGPVAYFKVVCMDNAPQVKAILVKALKPGEFAIDLTGKCVRNA